MVGVTTFSEPEGKIALYVWRFQGVELGVFSTLQEAEAALRRALKTGWPPESMYLLDSDGSFLHAGTMKTGHTVTLEERNNLGI